VEIPIQISIKLNIKRQRSNDKEKEKWWRENIVTNCAVLQLKVGAIDFRGLENNTTI
jgi:hypothetical protein